MLLESYLGKIVDLIKTIEREESSNLKIAAEKVADSLQEENVIHLFGCGHSHILTEEVYYRAGGLVPIHPIFHEPLMLHEGALRSSELERKNEYAQKFMTDQDIQEGDIMFVISTSGRNPVPVDAALIAKEKGAFVIGITSLEYSQSQSSRHTEGYHLYDAVDLVLDNHSPEGDALLHHPEMKVKFSPSSTVIGAAMLNGIFAEAIALMAEKGFEPPVFLSGNIDGADDHNQQLVEKYSERIKL